MPSAVDTAVGWGARLDLEIVRHGDRVVLGARKHSGPLRVQRPFHPEGPAPLHVYLLHPPGGLVGGDSLEISVRLAPEASAVVTTPAAQKLYRSAGRASTQVNELRCAAGSALEWLPAETIAFDGARSSSLTRVELEASAVFLGWELGCFGRPASGQRFTRGLVRQAFELYREGVPLLVDRFRVEGGSRTLEAAPGFASWPAFGALYCVPPTRFDPVPCVESLRTELAAHVTSRCAVAVTAPDDLLVVRASAVELELVRGALQRAWAILRPLVVGRRAVAPRIWAV